MVSGHRLRGRECGVVFFFCFTLEHIHGGYTACSGHAGCELGGFCAMCHLCWAEARSQACLVKPCLIPRFANEQSSMWGGGVLDSQGKEG